MRAIACLPDATRWSVAYDPYLFVKNAYLQRRDYLLSGGQIAEQRRERR